MKVRDFISHIIDACEKDPSVMDRGLYFVVGDEAAYTCISAVDIYGALDDVVLYEYPVPRFKRPNVDLFVP